MKNVAEKSKKINNKAQAVKNNVVQFPLRANCFTEILKEDGNFAQANEKLYFRTAFDEKELNDQSICRARHLSGQCYIGRKESFGKDYEIVALCYGKVGGVQ